MLSLSLPCLSIVSQCHVVLSTDLLVTSILLLHFFKYNCILKVPMSPKDLGYGTIMLAAAFFKMVLDLSKIERKAVPHLTQWPPSKLSHSQEVGCFKMFLYTSLVFPFCLCASLPSNATKRGFSLRFQLGFGMMSLCSTLCGHSKNILPSASSGTGWGC